MPKTFTVADQIAFARWSGDVNPMHMDDLFARRTYSGAAVVHGVHLVLTALDAFASSAIPEPAAYLRVTFSKPVNVGDTVEFEVQKKARDVTILLLCAGARVCSIKVTGAGTAETLPLAASLPAGPMDEMGRLDAPRALAFEEMPGRSGRLRVPGQSRELARAFPAAASWLHLRRLQTLVGLSYLVGMVCPGLNSIFSSMALELTSHAASDEVAFHVEEVDDRFRRVMQKVAGPGLSGLIGAYSPKPVQQPSCSVVQARVAVGRFAGARALVVGGSRGLGEVTAKVIAMGGGEPIVTYAAGQGDAERVAAEIHAAGGRCQILRLDVLAPIRSQLAGIEGALGSVFYFSTPSIFRKGAGVFDPASYALFSRFYLDGFHDICLGLRARGSQSLVAFYPSSSAVEERPQGISEYAMVKAAGEVLCAEINRFESGIEVIVRRLPRLATDLTASLLQTETRPVLDVLIPIVEEVIRPVASATEV